MSEPSSVMYGAMLIAYNKCESPIAALSLFDSIKLELRDERTYVGALQSCAMCGDAATGERIHCEVIDRDEGLAWGERLVTTLVHMYGKCGEMDMAVDVFNDFRTRNGRATIEMWTSIVSCLGLNTRAEEALEWYEGFKLEHLAPNQAMYLSVLTAMSHGGMADAAEHFYETEVHSSFRDCPKVVTCVVDALGRKGMLDEAEDVKIAYEARTGDHSLSMHRAVLAACRVHKDYLRLNRTFEDIQSRFIDSSDKPQDESTVEAGQLEAKE